MLWTFIEAIAEFAQNIPGIMHVDSLFSIVGNSFTVLTSVAIATITYFIGRASSKTNKRNERERNQKIEIERKKNLLNLSNYLMQNRNFFENIGYPIYGEDKSYMCVIYFDFDPGHNEQTSEFTTYGFAKVQSKDNPKNVLSFEFIGHSQVEPTSIIVVEEPMFDPKSDTWDSLFHALHSALIYTIKSKILLKPVLLDGEGVETISQKIKFSGKERGHAKMNTKVDHQFVNAILSVNAKRVKSKIGKISHIDARDSRGRTFLHYAVSIAYSQLGSYYKHINIGESKGLKKERYLLKILKDLDKIVSILIKNNANVNARDNRGEPVMYAAVASGNFRAVDLLINAGARTNITSKHSRSTALHVAVFSGWEVIVEKLIENGSDLDRKNLNGDTPLHFACQQGQLSIVEALIKNGAKVNERNKDGETPLHKAASSGEVFIVRILIEHGAVVNERSDAGETPLHKASYAGSPLTIETLLVCGAEVNEMDSDREAPLHKASYTGSLQSVKALVKMGARLDDTNSKRETPLHIALKSSDPDAALPIVNYFIDKGANVSSEDSNGTTPHELILRLIFRRKKLSMS